MLESTLQDGWLVEVLAEVPDREITLKFQDREDGGLRVWSDDVPGLVLSGPDPVAVIGDVGPALSVLLIQARRLSGLST